VLLALLVAAFGVVFLVNQLGDPDGTNAVSGKAAATAPAKPTVTGAPKTSAPPTTPAAVVDPSTDKKLESFVKSYYSAVTKHTDRTWAQLSPTMQNTARGRDGYDGFWGTIDKVKVNEVRANAAANNAVANLTFTSKNGATSTETHQFTFVRNDDGYLIESDRLG
jgi:eukaryotic-like serine/threonine-protein kinase